MHCYYKQVYAGKKFQSFFSPLLVSNAAERTEQGAGETGTGKGNLLMEVGKLEQESEICLSLATNVHLAMQ